MQSRWCYAVLVLAAIGGSSSSPAPPPQGQPHLILIVADDLGWNDVSWHNPQVLTPHLENLARGGVILEQSYVQPICTPTRSALLTGRYPFTLGRQHGVLWPKEPTGLTLKATLLPESLKEVGYSTHAVGKWHLGFCSWRYTPTRRGFDTFYGYYTEKDGARFGYDFRNNTTPDLSVDGTYSTYALASYVEDLLASRSPADPMFLYLPFQSVHSPLQVPENYTRPYRYIKHKQRRTKLGMVTAMDEAVGRVVSALKSSGHYNNSVIVFTTDNGGPTVSAGNNWPLRGNKSTLWEGGTRGAAFVHSPLLQNPGTVSHKLVHVTDWYETFMGLAGGKASEDTDGFDQWAALDGRSRSPRTHMIYNIDNTTEFSGGIRFGDYKLLVGNPGPGEWTPPPEGIQDTLTDVPDDIANNSTPSSALFHLTLNHTVDYPDVQDRLSMNITYLAASNASRLDASVDADVNGILVTTGNVTTSSWNAQLDNHEEYEVKEEEEDGERVRMEEKEEKEEEEEEEEEEKEEEGEGVEEEEKEGVDEEEKIKEKEETEEGKAEEEKQEAEEEEDKEERDLQDDQSVEDRVNTTEKGEEKYESVGDYLHAREFVDSLLNTKEIRLFNLKHDPDERINLAASKPEVVKILLALLLREMKTRYVDADLLPNDPRANPKYWHNFWSPGWCKAK